MTNREIAKRAAKEATKKILGLLPSRSSEKRKLKAFFAAHEGQIVSMAAIGIRLGRDAGKEIPDALALLGNIVSK